MSDCDHEKLALQSFAPEGRMVGDNGLPRQVTCWATCQECGKSDISVDYNIAFVDGESA